MLNDLCLSINANDKQGCFVEILERIQQQLDAMISYHSRVMTLRFDLHVYEYEVMNSLLSRFFRKLRKRLVSRYGIKRLAYVWVREIEKAKKQHYHCALFIDANKVRHPAKIIRMIEDIWQWWDQPKPYTPQHCFYLIDRKSHDQYSECFRRLSYLAKERGKGYKHKTANDYSTSRIKPKIDKTGI